MVAATAVGGLAATAGANERAFVEELWRTPVPVGEQRYFDGMLYVIGLSLQRELLRFGGRIKALHLRTSVCVAISTNDRVLRVKRCLEQGDLVLLAG